LASLSQDGVTVSLGWSGALPAPGLDGPTATYRGVLPGVDLRIVQEDEGFAETLVIADRSAARRVLAAPPQFTLSAQGGSVRLDGTGQLSIVDSAGRTVFVAPAPTARDSRGGGAPSRLGPVAVRLSGDRLTLVPDAGLLLAPDTRYPVLVDPSFTASTLNWASVLSAHPSGSYWNGQNLSDPTDPYGEVMVGYYPGDPDVARAFFQMNTASMNTKHILGATFRAREGWSNSCDATEVDLY
jgi:hypothetical protein